MWSNTSEKRVPKAPSQRPVKLDVAACAPSSHVHLELRVEAQLLREQLGVHLVLVRLVEAVGGHTSHVDRAAVRAD